MNYFNDYAVDELAGRVVNAYLKACGEGRICVDPAELCEKVLGLRVLYVKLSLDGSILGVTSFGEAKANIVDETGDWNIFPLDGKTVLIEKDLAENPASCGRLNFTVAHEASHHVFGRIGQGGSATANRLTVYRSKKYSTVEFDEWQTDRLTAAILMNRPMLKAAMTESGIPDGIKVLDDRLDNDEWYGFCRTAEILGVSLSALETRMTQLRLIEKNYRHNKGGSILDIG